MIKSFEARSENPIIERGQPLVPPVDQAAVLQRVGGDRQLLAELTEVFAQHCLTQLIELRAAIAAGECQRIENISHGLRSGLLNLGAGQASESAMRLEEMGRSANLTCAKAEQDTLEREIERAQKELMILCQAVAR